MSDPAGSWDVCSLADRVAGVLASREAALRLEQAVYGLDVLDERPLQTLICEGLNETYDVVREAHYPSTVGRKLSHRPRCDVVLTPLGRPLRLDRAPPTLFDPIDAAGPGEAFWLEMKTARQFAAGGGSVAEPHRQYGRQWREAIVRDLKKLDADPMVRSAGLLLLVFTETVEVVSGDLGHFDNVLARKEVLAGDRQTRHVPILDRVGHRVVTAALWPTVLR